MGRTDNPTHPDWVRCAACWSIYAPSVTGTEGCPKCGSVSWVRTAIPDGAPPAPAVRLKRG